MVSLNLFIVGLLFSFAVAGVLFLILRDSSLVDKVIKAGLSILIYLVMATVILNIVGHSYGTWGAGRLVPTVALCKGFEPYSTRERGAIQTTMYPPAWVLSYLPVCLGATPTGVLMLGFAVTQILTFVPALVCCLMGSASKAVSLIAFSIFVFAATKIPALKYSCFSPHADGPGLGFALIACLFILQERKNHVGKWVFPILTQ